MALLCRATCEAIGNGGHLLAPRRLCPMSESGLFAALYQQFRRGRSKTQRAAVAERGIEFAVLTCNGVPRASGKSLKT
jgi:hypothetical protein